jgi:hypothetical protein
MRLRIAIILALLMSLAVSAQAAFTIFQNRLLVTYTGLVGTRGKVPASYDVSNNQMMSKTFHYARASISSLQVRFACWYELTSNNVESAPGSNCVIKGSVEYPPGTCVPLTFAAASSATVTAGSDVLSDAVSISIPNGAKFFVNEYLTNASGIVLTDQQGDTTNGDSVNVGVSGITDRTVTCTSVPNSGGFQSLPLAIVGSTTQPSICLLGDSIGDGVHDVYSGTSGDIGILARSVGPSYGYSNLAVSGDASGRYNAGHVQRAKLLSYCTSAISNYGHNNFYNDGEGLQTMEANQMTMYGTVAAGMIGAKKIIQTTLLPHTTCGSNDWISLACQTVGSFNASFVTYNSDLRSAATGPPGGFYDANSILGTSTNGMFWITNGTANFYSFDGVHPAPAGYALIQSSGIINLSRLQ